MLLCYIGLLEKVMATPSEDEELLRHTDSQILMYTTMEMK